MEQRRRHTTRPAPRTPPDGTTLPGLSWEQALNYVLFRCRMSRTPPRSTGTADLSPNTQKAAHPASGCAAFLCDLLFGVLQQTAEDIHILLPIRLEGYPAVGALASAPTVADVKEGHAIGSAPSPPTTQGASSMSVMTVGLHQIGDGQRVMHGVAGTSATFCHSP